MKMTLVGAIGMVLLVHAGNAQPYVYSLVPIDDRGNCMVRGLDVRTGMVRPLIPSVGRAVQLFPALGDSLFYVQNRSVLEVWHVGGSDPLERLLDGVNWVHEVLEVPFVDRVFVSLGTPDSCERTIIFARSAWSILDTITGFWNFQVPFLSRQGDDIFRLEPSTTGVMFNRFDGMTGRLDTTLLLTSTVPSFRFNPSLQASRAGLALLAYEVPPGGYSSQYLMVCDVEAGLCYSPFPVGFRCSGHFSSNGALVITERVEWDSTAIEPEQFPGRVMVYESHTGRQLGEVVGPIGARVAVVPDPPPIAYFHLSNGSPGVPIDTLPSVPLHISSLSPALTLARSGGFVLTVSGGGFVPESRVLWNGTERMTTFVSPTELQAAVLEADVFFQITAAVTVRNPDGRSSDSASFHAVNTLPAPVRPVLECVTTHPEGSFTAWFGYKNENTVPVYIPIGPKNKFNPPPQERGQPSVFLPGRHVRMFSVDFPGANLVWTLNGRTSTASRKSSRCP